MDYSTPAIEQGLAAWTDVQGMRWIILIWPRAERKAALKFVLGV